MAINPPSRSNPDAPPPESPERGRSTAEAKRGGRVGVKSASRFDRTIQKTARARRLRRDATEVEKHVWHKLRNGQIDGLAFHRQHPAGRYILDFFCPSLRLAIELDGGQHSETTDRDRDEWLQARGVTVVRFWNSDVTENPSGAREVIADVASQLREKMTPTRRWRADLPLAGGGKSRLLRD
jgi:very-short-patch-repair endonuclease